ncbi:uncharacterized protein PHALS_13534 [Plasmopara halstedii]|uniref:Uncharacterized protein n=1 Tax=Plasmopara halstedii TaxID=4781 RepID=A0A0P1AR17_PLAHL|nr:uncharacterized protein PHALS_13534 [Plasmopara halstedii]CEG43332.1 hypothetical protein PHALS_13534 [Plasmopara halstedii]|eukprot:XP_024579701.1 hypothetical protein PHALS_13534 [Plasmopara halstedii]
MFNRYGYATIYIYQKLYWITVWQPFSSVDRRWSPRNLRNKLMKSDIVVYEMCETSRCRIGGKVLILYGSQGSVTVKASS